MKLPDSPELAVDDYCFACGQANPRGLRLQFRFEGDEYACDFALDREYQGWTNIAHGGIVSTVLDEVMTRLLWERGVLAVTVELTVRLKKPVPVLQRCQARSRLLSSRKRVHTVEGEILLSDGQVAATGRAKFLEVEETEV